MTKLSKKDTKKLILEITPRDREILECFSQDRGISMKDYILRLLELAKIINEAQSRGETLALIKGDEIKARIPLTV